MLKAQTIISTWKCDLCGTEVISENSPFFNVHIKMSAPPSDPSCDIDLCQSCISCINVPSVIDFITIVVGG